MLLQLSKGHNLEGTKPSRSISSTASERSEVMKVGRQSPTKLMYMMVRGFGKGSPSPFLSSPVGYGLDLRGQDSTTLPIAQNFGENETQRGLGG
jgi:hypothetical protein